MLKAIVRSLTAFAMLAAFIAITPAPAHAHDGGLGAGLAIGTLLGLGIAGANAEPRYYGPPPAYASDLPPGCYRGPRQCGWAGRRCWYDRGGEYICRGGEWRCWRPTYCD